MDRIRRPGPEDLARLAGCLPTGRVFTSAQALERFAADESTRVRAVPDAVVEALSEDDVRECLAWAFAGGFAVVTRGAGTGVAGGSVAHLGGVVLSLARMDRITEIDEVNLTATCEPGVITGNLQAAAVARGLFYPPDPASSDSCSIGGNVSVGAGGPSAVKYGTTRDYLLGARVVLADGEVLSLGGKNVKDASGYHLLELMVGGEGTLGVVTQVTVRLIARPSRSASLLFPFATLADAAGMVTALLHRRLNPTLAEFMDEVAIHAAANHLGRGLPFSGSARAYVFVGFDGESEETLSASLEAAGEIGREFGALEVLAALDPGQEARIWESRRTLGDAMKRLGGELGKADVVVPRGSIVTLVGRIKEVSAALGVRIACFGHAGDGNVHVNVLREGLDQAAWDELLPRALAGVMDAVRELGGRPSGEHGIGLLKRGELATFLSARELELMRGIKRVFDPQGILNPGKVL